MDNKTLKTLEFDKILERLCEFAKNDGAKKIALALEPVSVRRSAEQMLDETDAAVTLILKYGSPDILSVSTPNEAIKRLSVGGGLSMSELLNIARILKCARLLKRYTAEQTGVLFGYIETLFPEKKLEERITSSIISEDEMSDNAGPELASIRRRIKNAGAKIRNTLDGMIHSQYYRKLLQDPIVTVRNNRYVVPVKAEHRGEVKGIAHDMSASGSTVFIEPESVVNANNELHELALREQAEIEKILLEISNEAAEITDELSMDYETIIHLDFVLAKAKLALEMKAVMPQISSDGFVHIKKGRHPLIDAKKVVPVDIELGGEFDTLVITGPNTGGKTVTLKTIGLFCLMAQAGLHIPAADGSHLPICPDIFADIGDEQSIEQSLSTFSSHMKKIVEISQRVTPGCLVLFDELGAGTDPVEGAALATAIIEDFRSAGAIIAATTHYSELKLYALSTVGVENASCEFDVATLSPTYRLLIGVPGRSNAFAISEKLGLSKRIIDRSKEMLSEDNIAFEDVLSKLEENRVSAEKNSEEAEDLRRETERLKKELAAEREKIEKQKDKIYDRAREKAEKIIQRAQQDIDRQIEEIKELRKKNDDMETLRQMQEVRRELGLKLKTNKPPKNRQTQVQNKNIVDINKLRPGADVLICDLGDRGSVISINKKDGTVVVQVGIMKITAKADNLALLPQEDTPSVKKERKRYSGGSGGGLRKAAVKPETDLRGMMLEEAEYAVDKYLDEAAMAGLGEVSIIHGKGTGVLRNGIREMLRRHPHVKSFRRGKYGEGEDGVTVVELK